MPGPRAVGELLRHAPGRVEALWLDRRHEGGELVALAEAAGIEPQWQESRALSRRAPDLDCQGVLVRARPPVLVDLEDLLDAALAEPAERAERAEPAESGGARGRAEAVASEPAEAAPGEPEPAGPGRRVLVALDGVQDPQNLGAIMRTCEFFGVLGLVWPRDRAAGVTPAVVRASAGASERLPLCRVVNLARALEAAAERGLWVVGTVPQGGQPLPKLVAEDGIPDPVLVVMGGEHGGLRRLTRARCDLLVTIPGRGGVASLNVSAATAATLAWLS
ncbi:MAG: RNA methyltransferase [Myxococcales bacterium]|nr:RNA methyltransferase [Myxococcales bacterium]